MLSNVLNALGRKRRDLSENDKGFTLIELLVVVIIIGILAAIAIPIYIGVQNNAKDSSAQSDVVNLKTAVVSMQTANSGELPEAADVLTSGAPTTDAADAGASKSDNTDELTYATDGDGGFCVAGESSTGTEFFATETGGVEKVDDTHTLPTACAFS